MYKKYSIYIHIPFCKARCSYCAFVSCTDLSVAESYFSKLFAEMDRYADKTKPIYTIYLGGGTPSYAGAYWLDKIFAKLNECFDLSHIEEITVECNPESTTDQLLTCLHNCGVTRLSFGLQSVNDGTLKRIGRLHGYKDFTEALYKAVSHGFANINADLIIGLPESHADFIRTVCTAAVLPLNHISLYALELHRGTSLYADANGKNFFSDDEQADMYDEAAEILSKHGFKRYEISNFAKVNCECKHNLHYWREGRYFAFGASASGFVDNMRFTNCMSVSDYIDKPIELLRESCEQIDVAEEANEFAMLGLRLDDGISLSEFEKRFGVDFMKFFSAAKSLVGRGLLICRGDRLQVPRDKFYVINSILSELWHSQNE